LMTSCAFTKELAPNTKAMTNSNTITPFFISYLLDLNGCYDFCPPIPTMAPLFFATTPFPGWFKG
jgi:hypothetical protein